LGLLDDRSSLSLHEYRNEVVVTLAIAPAFDEPGLLRNLDALSEGELDGLDFGVIGFDAQGIVCRYNIYESAAAGLSPPRVTGHALFAVVAPCMNNYLVAQRFEDAATTGDMLDATIDYVLTLRMSPVKVKLRLLAASDAVHRYVLVQRSSYR
jgi:photoactive yellow protein